MASTRISVGEARAVRILIVAPLPPPSGGIGRWTELLIKWAHPRKEINITIVNIAPRFKRGFDKRIVIRIIAGFLQGPLEIAQIFMRILFFKPDVMHLTTSGGLAGVRDCFAVSISKLFSIPTFYHLHFGTLSEKNKSNALEWKLICLTMRKADVILAVDEHTANVIQDIFKYKSVIFFPNAIDLTALDEAAKSITAEISRPYSSESRYSCQALYLGWVLPAKGLLELVRAWINIAPMGWDLKIIGPGPTSFKRELSCLAGGNPSIQIHGEVSREEAWRWMNLADILVLPTHTEGFPNVVLEAMAASKPIVATPVGAIPMILDFQSSDPCGISVPVGNAGALGERLWELIENPGLRLHLGNLARRKVENNYDIHVVFSKLSAMWKEKAERKLPPKLRKS